MNIGLVGGGTGGRALLDLVLEWPDGRVAVVVDSCPEAPALSCARAAGIPTAHHHLDVFRYPVELVFEVTGEPGVLDDLLRARPPHVEVVGATTLRFFRDLLEENARRYRRLEERVEKLTALTALTRLITSAAEREQVFEAVARSTTELLGARSSRVWEADESARVLRVQAGFGIDPAIDRVITEFRAISFGAGLVGRVFVSGNPEYVVDVAKDSRWLNRRLATEAGLHGYAALPLVVGDRTLGVLSILFVEPRQFSPAEKELMGFLAAQAAIAMNNALLYEGRQVRAARLHVLARLNRMVSSSLDTTEVLLAIALAAAELMQTRLVSIWTADETTASLHLRAFSDESLGRNHPGLARSFGEGGVGWVAAHRRSLNVPDVFADGRILGLDWYRQHGLRSCLALPILFGDSLLGVVVLFGETPVTLGADDEELLEGFVAQAAVAIHNARLYEELRLAHERLETSQAQLIQTERLRALGEMAAGVAHDFNNILAVILGRSDLLLRRAREPEIVRGLTAVRHAARAGADTVRRIQEFTRTRTTRPAGQVDLGAVVREVVELTRPRWKDDAQSRGVRYEIDVEGGAVPPVTGRAEELREVLTNLLSNALEAMPGGGRCTFRLAADGDRVCVSVTDTGVGMPEEVRRRVFEPFFSTKGPRGTGLGLALAFGVVTRHGGTIDVTSAPGNGSTFTLRLPAGDHARVAVGEPPAPPAPRAARILVIDDEPEVREVLASHLGEAGYRVVQAADGPAGLAWCEKEPFDVVITDLSMPRMSGWEVAAACRARFPSVVVGVVTGWGDRLDRHQLERHGIRFVVAKPFEGPELLRHVAAVLPDVRSEAG